MNRRTRARSTTTGAWALAAAPMASLAVLLSACTPSADEVRSRHAGAAAQGSSAQSSVRSAAPAPPSDADYVAAVATSKATLPFTVRFRPDSRPRVGQPLTVAFMITPGALAQIRSLKFRFEAGDGLQLQGDPEFVVTGATPGIAVHHELQVVPRSTGVIELQAHAAVETASEALSQTYAIPLIVTADSP